MLLVQQYKNLVLSTKLIKSVEFTTRKYDTLALALKKGYQLPLVSFLNLFYIEKFESNKPTTMSSVSFPHIQNTSFFRN